MKILTLTLLLVGAALGQDTRASQTPSPLTNQDVLDMWAAGLGTEVIVAKIQSSGCNFRTAPSDLASLKAAGTDDAILMAMLKTQALIASAPSPLKTAQVEPTASLHFYRDRLLAAKFRTMPIYVDEQQIASLVDARQFTVPIKPGKHTFRCRTKDDAITVEIEPGREYYFRAEFVQGIVTNRWRIVQIANQQGEFDTQRLRPLDPADITPAAKSGQIR